MSLKQQILDRVRIFNKYVLNRLTRYLAYAPLGPFAIVYHTGRRSGRHYEATIFAIPRDGDFIIALTYGPHVDWYRNVQAAGHCELLHHGQRYTINHIEAMDPASGRAAFGPLERPILRRMDIQHYVRMTSDHTSPTGNPV